MHSHASRASVQWIWVVVVLVVCGVAAAALFLMRTEPPKQEAKELGPLVEIVTVSRQDVPMDVSGHGAVRAVVRAQVVPQVSGRVLRQHMNMVSGGYIPAGQPLIEIDPADYQLAVAAAQADLEQVGAAKQAAEAAIAEAQARLKDARDDYDRTALLKTSSVATQRELDKAKVMVDVTEAALRTAESQKATAAAQHASANVALDKAKLNLSRTKVTMPFNAVVVSENVDPGQYVSAAQSVGDVYGTAAVEIAVPLADRELKWLRGIAVAGEVGARADRGNAPEGELPAATVSATIFGKACRWNGRVVRTEGELNDKTRMINIVVRVDDPFSGLIAGGSPPLIPGAFVDVKIEGKPLEHVVVLPRLAVRGAGDVVWVARGGKLVIVPVRIARTDHDKVYIDEGLSDGDQVIVSSLDVATDGMTIRTPDDAAAQASAAPTAPDSGDKTP